MVFLEMVLLVGGKLLLWVLVSLVVYFMRVVGGVELMVVVLVMIVSV